MTTYPMSDDERALVAQIERFSAEVLAPKAAQIDEVLLMLHPSGAPVAGLADIGAREARTLLASSSEGFAAR